MAALVGENFEPGAIYHSFATGAVSGGQSSQNGGLVGANNGGYIAHAFAKGSVIGGDSSENGGLIGFNDATYMLVSPLSVWSSFATGAVTGDGDETLNGGLVGENFGRVSSTYATDVVTSKGPASSGGLVGENFGTIENSPVRDGENIVGGGTDNNVGGLVGDNFATRSTLLTRPVLRPLESGLAD